MAVTATPAVACAGLTAVGGAAAASQLSRSLERLLEEAALSGELRLSGRKLRELPRRARELRDTVRADLSRNRLGEVPEEVTGYLYLERLLLAHNTIRSLPDTLGALHSLTYLDLSGNQLTEVPREVCLLPLQVLLLSDNRLAALPSDVGRLSALAELDAARNRLAHVPLSVGDLAALRALDLSDNRLGLLPLQVTYLKLETLDVSCNCISSLPLELRHMASLVHLRLDNNPLVSPPTTVCMRGRVHIFKYLESMASKETLSTRRAADDARRSAKHASYAGAGAAGAAAAAAGGAGNATLDCLRRARHADSGYSTSDGERRSHDVYAEVSVGVGVCSGGGGGGGGGALESSGSTLGSGRSTPSTPSTLSPGASAALSRAHSLTGDSPLAGLRTSPEGVTTNGDPKTALTHQQTYRQYKEALRQQRQQDVYRPRGDTPSSSPDLDSPSPHSQPHSPLHRPHSTPHSPSHQRALHSTPVAAALPASPLLHSTPRRFQTVAPSVNGNDAHRADENRRPVQKVVPSRNVNKMSLTNGNDYTNGRVANSEDVYVKPVSPSKSPTFSVPPNNVRSGIPTFNGEAKLLTTTVAYLKGASAKPAGSGRLTWSKDVPPDKLSFTMKREFDKQKEELDLLRQLRSIIESRLKMSLPEELAPVLADGVVLCHLANHVQPRSVGSVHVPSPAQPKLTMARCRRNVDNFLEACRKIGVEEEEMCSPEDILGPRPESEAGEGSVAPLARTLAALLARAPPTASPARHAPPAAGDVVDSPHRYQRDHMSLHLRNNLNAAPPASRPPHPPPPPPTPPAPENRQLVTALCLGGFLLTLLTLLLFPPQ